MFERGDDAVVLRRIDIVDLPSKGLENPREVRHGKHHPVVDIQLSIIAVDEYAKVVEAASARNT